MRANLLGSATMDGRRAQAARNDTAILEAARAVYAADPEAPKPSGAARAGGGISALYRRYPSNAAGRSTAGTAADAPRYPSKEEWLPTGWGGGVGCAPWYTTGRLARGRSG